jgi:L,D-peptidoglycan transpeptidase YkuD (ErfK/YbiS/YcfS/YnhG family)
MKILSIIIIMLFSLFIIDCHQEKQISPVSESSHQLILVLTPFPESANGKLIRFERPDGHAGWRQVEDSVVVLVGKKGLAWGRGLHKVVNAKIPIKNEGDRRSPAGVFTLNTAFGYLPAEKLGKLKFPYLQVTQTLECVDDVNSQYYNRLVERDTIDSPDWKSSEKMLLSGIWYELGVMVGHNAYPSLPGGGSCIFLHNWSDPADSTTGCTAMARSDLKAIIEWLDISKSPVLVQLTNDLYLEYRENWNLP